MPPAPTSLNPTQTWPRPASGAAVGLAHAQSGLRAGGGGEGPHARAERGTARTPGAARRGCRGRGSGARGKGRLLSSAAGEFTGSRSGRWSGASGGALSPRKARLKSRLPTWALQGLERLGSHVPEDDEDGAAQARCGGGPRARADGRPRARRPGERAPLVPRHAPHVLSTRHPSRRCLSMPDDCGRPRWSPPGGAPGVTPSEGDGKPSARSARSPLPCRATGSFPWSLRPSAPFYPFPAQAPPLLVQAPPRERGVPGPWARARPAVLGRSPRSRRRVGAFRPRP